jgi:hypothetical protein
MKITKRIIELSGKRFGKLTVLELESIRPSGPGRNRTYWLCKCDCGVEKSILGQNLINGSTSSCGCGRLDYIERCHIERLGDAYFNSLKKNAERRQIEFKISKEYLFSLFLRQERKCALSGIELFMPMLKMNREKHIASVDRIDSFKGYIEGNVQWVHKDINRMKMDLPEEYFLSLCNQISKYKGTENG